MPSPIAQNNACIVNRFLAACAAVRVPICQTRDVLHQVNLALFCLQILHPVSEMVEELVEPFGHISFSLQLQGTLQTNPDKQLEIVSQPSDQRQQLLRDTKLALSGLLGLGKQREERDDLLAEEFCFATICQICTPRQL